MNIIIAQEEHTAKIHEITERTISLIYPAYYPQGAVDFFIAHHGMEAIRLDILKGIVYLAEAEGEFVGTVTIRDNEICRLFVLPEYQGRGYGGKLLAYAEKLACGKDGSSIVDASLPAKAIYVNKGYRETEYHKILCDNGDYLCYDVMVRKPAVRIAEGEAICYEGRTFVTEENTDNGEVNSRTVFMYHQEGGNIWAAYEGGGIVKGFLTGFADADGCLHFAYQHTNEAGEIRVGECDSRPHIQENGLLRMYETWHWLNGDLSSGSSVLREIEE